MNEKTNIEIENFIFNVSEIRKHFGLSKNKMAKTLKIELKTLDKIENGKFPENLSVEVVFEIYKNFGIPPKDLFSKRYGNNNT